MGKVMLKHGSTKNEIKTVPLNPFCTMLFWEAQYQAMADSAIALKPYK